MTGYAMPMRWKSKPNLCWNPWPAVSIIILMFAPELSSILIETKRQITLLEEILDRNDISRSVLKDSMSKMAALGQSIGGMFPSDEIVKGSISGYVFEQFEIACYTSLLAAAKKAGDVASVPAIETILAEEREMADWLIRHIPQTTEQFLLRSDASGVEAKK